MAKRKSNEELHRELWGWLAKTGSDRKHDCAIPRQEAMQRVMSNARMDAEFLFDSELIELMNYRKELVR